MKKQLKCYIYTRVSTSMQVDGYSLDAQKDKLHKYADYQDMIIAGEYSDEGKSGKSVEGRPQFQQMLQDIESGKDNIDFVLVFKLSRFGRNAADVLSSLQRMQDFGVNLICVEDGIDSSKDAGKLMISVLSAVAEIERENILVQTMEGRRQKAREGKWNGGFAPYGYQLINGELLIAEDEAEIIRIIYDKFANTTMGIAAIATFLNNSGYKKKLRQNNTIEGFSASFVKGVLDNPVYCGKLAFGRRKNEKVPGTRNEYHIVKQDKYMLNDGIHEAIVSEELWNQVHKKRQETGVANIKTHSLDHEHILSGIIKCPICGSGMYGNVNRKKHPDGGHYRDYFYYACKHRTFVNGHKCTYRKQWSEDKINAAVEEVIRKLVNNPKFKTEIQKHIGQSIDTQELDREHTGLQERLKQVIGAKNKLANQMDNLSVSDKHYDKKYEDMQVRLDKLYDEIEEIETLIEEVETRLYNIRQEKISGDNVYQFLLFFDKLYDRFTDIEKKTFMKSFLAGVNIYEEEQADGRILRSLKFRFPVFFNGKEIYELDWDNESTVDAWRGFQTGNWTKEIDVRDFINRNFTSYNGDGSFLSGMTERTRSADERVKKLLIAENEKGGVLDVDTEHVSSLLAYGPGYIKKGEDIILGLQTDAPLKRAVNPFAGYRNAVQACEAYGYKISPKITEEFAYRTTHNTGVFRVYTETMRRARHAGILTGLPDAYARGRIIGDYRRVALYGMDRLIEEKKADKVKVGERDFDMSAETIQLLEDIAKQLEFMEQLKTMAAGYGCDISRPAENMYEAIQWLYFGYLGAIKEQNGAANSIGRISAFIDIYAERDLAEGTLTEEGAQELIDDLVLKLRLVRHLRTPDYNDLFAGDPVWVTCSLAGLSTDGRSMVTKTCFRFLQTLYNLGPSAEPNLTVLWSQSLPQGFKDFCAQVSIDTDSIQYENDDVMRGMYGDDYAIACCVSAMKVGRQMQYFGARCNLAKVLLMALNGGKDEKFGEQIAPEGKVFDEKPLVYEEVLEAYKKYASWMANLYVKTMNIIHYMHDKYAYERLMMSLHDTDVERLMAFGISGMSVLADSLSAIKYAKVTPVKDERGVITDFITEGDFPKYGNDDDRVDDIAKWIVDYFYHELCKTKAYRGAEHTLSILTITSNVMYGKKTGATPDGRKAGEPFAPGANPMHGRDAEGALASLNSVAKLDYGCCRDGISNTFSVTPETLGHTNDDRVKTLTTMLDGYFAQDAHHLNVNVLNRQKLIDAMNDPTLYPSLTIRVSGYAVNFNKLTREKQEEVISRTFHEKM